MDCRHFRLSAPKARQFLRVQGWSSEVVQVLAGGSKGPLEPGEESRENEGDPRISRQGSHSISCNKNGITTYLDALLITLSKGPTAD